MRPPDEREADIAGREHRVSQEEKRLEAATAALLDRATEQAIMLWLLKKMRGRMSRAEATAIASARQRQMDGQSHYRQLDAILKETAQEIEDKKRVAK